MIEIAMAWLLTYWIHSTLVLSAVWLLSRFLRERNLALEETSWRIALFVTLVTATLQVGAGSVSDWRPIGGVVPLESTAPEVAPVEGAETRDARGARREPGAAGGPTEQYALPIAGAEVLIRPSVATQQVDVSGLLWAVWLLTAGLLGLRFVIALGLVLRDLRDRQSLGEGSAVDLLARLCRRAGVSKKVGLSICRALRVPLALGVRRWEVCLPTRVAKDFAAEEQETVLAHELAHLMRYDSLWQLAATAMRSVFFFQPLNFVAASRLRALAELRCDDWAVEHTGRPVTLAKCLTKVAASRTESWKSLPVPAMASASRSHFGHRVRRLLAREYPRPTATVPRWLRLACLPALIVFVAAAPAAMRPAHPPAPEPPTAPAAREAREAHEVDTPERPAAPAAAPTPALAPAPAPVPKPIQASKPGLRQAPKLPKPSTAPALARPELPDAPPVPVLAEELSAVVTSSPSLAPVVSSAPSPGAVRSVPAPAALVSPALEPAPVPAPVVVASLAAPEVTPESRPVQEAGPRRDGEDWDDEGDEELEDFEDALDEELDALEDQLEAEIEEIEDEVEDQLEEFEESTDEEFEALFEEFEEGLEVEVEGLEDEIEALENALEERYEGIGSEAALEALDAELERIESALERVEERHERELERLERRHERNLERLWERDFERHFERAFESYERTMERRFEAAAREMERAARRFEASRSPEERARQRAELKRLAEQMRPSPEELAALRAQMQEVRGELAQRMAAFGQSRAEFRQALEEWRVRYLADLARVREESRGLGQSQP